jgi:AAA family ATP:ADP antiporter
VNILNVQKGEWGKVIVTWTMNVLLSIGYVIGWSAVHSMLVKRMGVEYLPYTYIGISLLGVLGSTVYLTFADAVRRDRLLVWFSVATGGVLVLARFLVSARSEDGETGFTLPLVLFFIAVFFAQGVGNSSLGTQVWTIINDIFRPSQGKRLYPIIGTAGTVGGIVGGVSIHYLASSIGTANLVLIWAASIFLLVPLTWWVRKNFGGELSGRRLGAAHAEKSKGRIREGWRFFTSSKMSTTLGFVAVMFWVVGSVADFQYTRIMNATFPSESQLAGYYGLYGMVINTSGLLVQMLFSGYLIRRIGVGRGLCFLPASALVGFGLIAAKFAFWPGLILRYSWDMIGMTVQGNSYQLALNAIPHSLRARVRGVIEGVINPLGGVLGGLLILALHHLFDSTAGSGWTDPVTIAGVVLLGAWLLVVSRSQKNYMALVESNLRSGDNRTVMDAIDCLEERHSPHASELLVEAAQMPDPNRRIAAARVLGNIGGEHQTRELLTLCRDSSERVRKEALRAMERVPARILAATGASTVVEPILENDPDPAVRAEALRFLLGIQPHDQGHAVALRWLRHGSPIIRARMANAVGQVELDHRALLEPLLNDPSPLVQAEAIHALWPQEAARPAIRTAVAALIRSDHPEAALAALKAFHHTGECPDTTFLEKQLDTPDPLVRVLAGAGAIRFSESTALSERALELILEALGNPAESERLRIELLPLVPDFGEEATDAILLGAATLPQPQKTNVSQVLSELFHVFEARIQNN